MQTRTFSPFSSTYPIFVAFPHFGQTTLALALCIAHSAYITAIEQKGKDYKFILYEKANLDPEKIPALLKKYGNNMIFKAEAVPYFLYQKKGRSGKEKGENVLQMLREIIESIRELRLDQGS